MEVAAKDISREDYFKIQIDASKKKFKYCKVSVNCVLRFKEILKRSNMSPCSGPILCLGTRNGREIDLFRIIFFGSRIRNLTTRLLEIQKNGFSSLLRIAELVGKSNIDRINEKSVVGVELNPDGKRSDVLVGSFDELPRQWTSRFNILYANTLDHAQDPLLAAKEWNRVLKVSGYFIFGYSQNESSEVTCVGNITFDDIRRLFPGELIYFNKHGNWYADIIIKKIA